jgi:hypothetical protein
VSVIDRVLVLVPILGPETVIGMVNLEWILTRTGARPADHAVAARIEKESKRIEIEIDAASLVATVNELTRAPLHLDTLRLPKEIGRWLKEWACLSPHHSFYLSSF